MYNLSIIYKINFLKIRPRNGLSGNKCEVDQWAGHRTAAAGLSIRLKFCAKGKLPTPT